TTPLLPQRFPRGDVERLQFPELLFGLVVKVVLLHLPADPRTRSGRPERRHAMDVERNVECARVGMVGHGPQSLHAAGAGTEEDFLAGVLGLDQTGTIGGSSGGRVDVEQRLVSEVRRADKFPRLAIQLPENSDLAHAVDRALPI